MKKQERLFREDRHERVLLEIELAKRATKPSRTLEREGVLPFRFVAEPDGDEVTAWSGLTVVLELMKQLGLQEHVNERLAIKQRDAGFTPFQLITAFVLLLVAGGECLDDIEVLRNDAALCTLLGHALPSADTMRRFLERFHDPAVMKGRERHEGKAWIAPESELLERLGHVMVRWLRAVVKNESEPPTCATIDHDATIIEAHKQEATAHYKGGRGYQPAIGVWAELGLVVADEFRDGNVPAGMNNVPLIARSFAALPESVTTRFFRADSACYDEDVLKWLVVNTIGFAISADMTRELRAACVALPASAWTLHEERADATVDVADVEFTPGNWPKSANPLRYIALRFRPTQGSLFHDGSSERFFAIVTNRSEPAGDLVDWHRMKAGTVEAVHDVTKNELGAGVLPSGKYGANAAWYRIVMLTHNVLVAMKHLALPPELKTARPKRLRFRVFALAAKVITHARSVFARVAARLLAHVDVVTVRRRIVALAPA